MTLWIILTLMVAVVAAVLTIPLVRRHEARADARTATLAVLRDQLADVDVQIAAGAIPPADAEGLRIEIKRRMLAAGHIPEEARAALAARTLSGMAIGLAALVALAGGALYATMSGHQRRWPRPQLRRRQQAPRQKARVKSPHWSPASRRRSRPMPTTRKAGACSAGPISRCSALTIPPAPMAKRWR